MRRAATACAVLVALALAAPAAAAEIEVSAGPTTLGEAILLAEPGDTIVLPAGEYLLTEGEVLQEKNLTLKGAGEGETTIVPSGGGDALDDPGVTVIGVTEAPPLQPDEAATDGTDASGDSGEVKISTKAQVIAVIATLAIFLFVLDLVRRRRLAERYALLWMSAAFALLVLAIWTDGLDIIKDLIGVEEPANAIFLLAFGVAFLLLLNFSVVSSRLSEETKILAQEVARLETELDKPAQQRRNFASGSDTEEEPDGAPVTAQQGPKDG